MLTSLPSLPVTAQITFTPAPSCVNPVDCGLNSLGENPSPPYPVYEATAGSDIKVPYSLAKILVTTFQNINDIGLRIVTYNSATVLPIDPINPPPSSTVEVIDVANNVQTGDFTVTVDAPGVVTLLQAFYLNTGVSAGF